MLLLFSWVCSLIYVFLHSRLITPALSNEFQCVLLLANVPISAASAVSAPALNPFHLGILTDFQFTVRGICKLLVCMRAGESLVEEFLAWCQHDSPRASDDDAAAAALAGLKLQIEDKVSGCC
jgi:hypothetical protein